jgi:hypothetical protein
MTAQHGTNSRYAQVCRCDACRQGHRHAARAYAERKAAGQVRPRAQLEESCQIGNFSERRGVQVGHLEPGPVELGVQAEIEGAGDRPGLAAVALAMARLLDDPKAKNQQPAAAKVLAALLDKLRSASTRGRHGGLAVVRTMTEKGGA